MKLVRHAYITRPLEFAQHPTRGELTLFASTLSIASWFYVGEVEIDADIDMVELKKFAGLQIDGEIIEREAEIEVLKQKRAELLSLTYDGGEVC